MSHNLPLQAYVILCPLTNSILGNELNEFTMIFNPHTGQGGKTYIAPNLNEYLPLFNEYKNAREARLSSIREKLQSIFESSETLNHAQRQTVDKLCKEYVDVAVLEPAVKSVCRTYTNGAITGATSEAHYGQLTGVEVEIFFPHTNAIGKFSCEPTAPSVRYRNPGMIQPGFVPPTYPGMPSQQPQAPWHRPIWEPVGQTGFGAQAAVGGFPNYPYYPAGSNHFQPSGPAIQTPVAQSFKEDSDSITESKKNELKDKYVNALKAEYVNALKAEYAQSGAVNKIDWFVARFSGNEPGSDDVKDYLKRGNLDYLFQILMGDKKALETDPADLLETIKFFKNSDVIYWNSSADTLKASLLGVYQFLTN